MKSNKKISHFKTQLICTDGSTFSLELPFLRTEIFLSNDLRNNISYKKIDSNKDNLIKNNTKKFDFYSLIK